MAEQTTMLTTLDPRDVEGEASFGPMAEGVAMLKAKNARIEAEERLAQVCASTVSSLTPVAYVELAVLWPTEIMCAFRSAGAASRVPSHG